MLFQSLQFSFLMLLSVQTLAAESLPPSARIVSQLGDEDREEGQLLMAIKDIPVVQKPRSQKKVFTLKAGDEAMLLDYQEHIFPVHIKTKDLDFYVTGVSYGGKSTSWTLWMNGKTVNAEGSFDNPQNNAIWKLNIEGQSYELPKADIPSPFPKSEYWMQVQKLKGGKGWTLYSDESLAMLERVFEEKIDILKHEWNTKSKLNSLSWEEARLRLEKGHSFDFQNAYRPRQFKGFTYPQISFFYLSFSEPEAIYKFKSCRDLKSQMQKSIPMSSHGQKPFQVRENRFFIETDSGYSSDVLIEDCLNLTENNAYECPNYTDHYERVLSKVGPLLTIEYGYMGGGGCGPSYSEFKVKTIDLRNGKEALITDFFEQSSLMEALSQDSVVKEKMAASGKSIESFEAVTHALSLRGFAVYEPSLHNGKVRIRWSSEVYECGMCPNQYEWLGLDVKPLPWFFGELKKVDPKKELYLIQK